MPEENTDFKTMVNMMSSFESHVNGQQRRELYGLAWYKLHYSDSATYLDVGTNLGNSAITMASAIKHQAVNIPAKVYTVDNYSESENPELDIETARENIHLLGVDDLVEIHVGDDLPFINSLPDGSIDMVFDDTDHGYLPTFQRLCAYMPKMNTNSLIAGHDYYVNFPSIIKAVEDFRSKYQDRLSALVYDTGMFWMFCNLEM